MTDTQFISDFREMRSDIKAYNLNTPDHWLRSKENEDVLRIALNTGGRSAKSQSERMSRQ